MNGPTKTVGPPLTPLPARKSRGVLENVVDNADAVIDGIWPDSTGPSAGLKSTETDIQTAVNTFNDPYTYFIPIANDPVQAWMTGTGHNTAPTGTGNADAYTASDGVHPSDIGRLYEVQREVAALRNVIQQIP